jgi:hypothetical protein
MASAEKGAKRARRAMRRKECLIIDFTGLPPFAG